MSEKIELWGVKDPNISAQLALAARLGHFLKAKSGLMCRADFSNQVQLCPEIY